MNQDTLDSIAILKRMDLEVAVPIKYERNWALKDDATTTTVAAQYIHVPSIIYALEREIRARELEIQDIKRAIQIVDSIKREPKP